MDDLVYKSGCLGASTGTDGLIQNLTVLFQEIDRDSNIVVQVASDSSYLPFLTATLPNYMGSRVTLNFRAQLFPTIDRRTQVLFSVEPSFDQIPVKYEIQYQQLVSKYIACVSAFNMSLYSL